MRRILIVNADDCNLTAGATHAILDCHDHGIVTSTTFLVNLPIDLATLRAIRRRQCLGIGVHLNVTLGKPVSDPSRVASLIGSDGNFRKVQEQLRKPPRLLDLHREYENQIVRFKKIFGKPPTHLDTHHQVHDHPLFLRVLLEVARRNRLPIRRSRGMTERMQTPNFLFGNLNPKDYWRRIPLVTLLENLPEGVSEIMCHPGRNDRDLRAISSFTSGREEEWQLFRSAALRRLVQRQGVLLSHYGVCYT